jgi:hypothetical protein
MKTFLLSFLFLISTFSLWGQETKIHYMRAHNVSMGFRQDEHSNVSSWVLDGQKCNILVELHQTKVIIYSQKVQTYRIINQVERTENNSKWLCKDDEGISCYFRMSSDPEYPGLMSLAVEYNDVVWFYIASHE